MQGFDETFDWVVVGSGGGSMASALVMREAGKSVVILEKSRWVGGTTAKSGGVMWIPNNRFMREAGDEDSAEAAITYLDTVAEDVPGTSPEKRRAYVHEAPRMVDFLVGKGVALERAAAFWPDYYDELPGGCKTSRTVTAAPFDKRELGAWKGKLRQGFLEMPVRLEEGFPTALERRDAGIRKAKRGLVWRVIKSKLKGEKFVSAGAGLQGRMLKASLEAGVDIRTETPVRQLLFEAGKVTGVELAGGKRIGARLGVLVNAGGYGQDQVMRDRYQPGTRAAWSLTNESDTGDLHREMERIGAQLAQMDQAVGYQTTLAPGWEQAYVTPPAQSLTAKPHAILVDQSGRRYMNEGGSYELYCETMRKRDAQTPAIPSWAILDRQYVETYKVADKFIDRKVPKGWREKGYLHMADSIEGLADSIGVDAGNLKDTVARWNGFVRNNRDEDFHRGERAYDHWLGDRFQQPNPSLGTIDKAPFYAVPVVPGDVSTYGGAVTDEKARVLDKDGKVIDGLYATGVSSASTMGAVYPGAGCSIGPSFTFGYIAAKHAAGLDNQLG